MGASQQLSFLMGRNPFTQRGDGYPKVAGNLRQAIYMPALVATRFNPDFKAKYQVMIKAGKPAKVAIVTIIRKIIVLANALLKRGRKWQIKTP